MQKNITIEKRGKIIGMKIYGEAFLSFDTVEQAKGFRKVLLRYFEKYKKEILDVKQK